VPAEVLRVEIDLFPKKQSAQGESEARQKLNLYIQSLMKEDLDKVVEETEFLEKVVETKDEWVCHLKV